MAADFSHGKNGLLKIERLAKISHLPSWRAANAGSTFVFIRGFNNLRLQYPGFGRAIEAEAGSGLGPHSDKEAVPGCAWLMPGLLPVPVFSQINLLLNKLHIMFNFIQ